MTYHAVTVTLENVDGIVLQKDRTGVRTVGTTFNVKVVGKRHYAVQMRGAPRLESGMMVTAVLRDTENWQTLVGWLNHSTGEVCGVDAPWVGFTKFMIVLLVSAFYFFRWRSGMLDGSIGVMGGVMFAAAAVGMNGWSLYSWRKSVKVYGMLVP